MLRLLKGTLQTDAYADAFIARYDRLFAWSLKLTDRDRQMAEDLVHDTFVQFMLNRPDLHSVKNLEGYLYAMLKNTHLSQLRRASQKPQHNLALIEYDSAEISLREIDVRARLQVQEELWNVCQYACLRKDTSKAGRAFSQHLTQPSLLAGADRASLPTSFVSSIHKSKGSDPQRYRLSG